MFLRIIQVLTPDYIKAGRAEREAWAVLHDIEQQRNAVQKNGQAA